MDRENVVMPSIISNKHIIIESQWVDEDGGGGVADGERGGIFTLPSWKRGRRGFEDFIKIHEIS